MKRVNVVKTQDILELGRELQMRMRAKKIEIEKVIEWGMLDENIKKKKSISIKEIREKLSFEPFLIKDIEVCLKFARFLVEDSEEDIILFNENSEININIFKSRFRYIIGKYTLYTIEEEDAMQKRLVQLLKQQRGVLTMILDSLNSVKTSGQVTQENLQEIFDTYPILEEFN